MKIHIIHLPQRVDRLELLFKELDEQKITDFKIWEGIIDLNITAKGISKAHKQIVQYAKDEGLNEVLIAEDDLKFTSKNSFKFFIKNKPIDFDIYLSSIYHGELEDDNTVKDFSGLTFYIIHQRFYNAFLSSPEHYDLDRSLKNKGKFVVCNPFSIIQFAGYSDNQKNYCDYSNYLKTRELYFDETN